MITLTAVPVGLPAGDTVKYQWSFGDGESDETSSPSTSHSYAAGLYSVSVTLVDETSGKSAVDSKIDALYVVSKTLYVTPGNLEHASFPFSTPQIGASNVMQAVDAAIEGCEIVVGAGTSHETKQLALDKALTVRGATGHPEDVVICGVDSAITWWSAEDASFRLACADARIENVTCHNSANRPALAIGIAGGTVSNCVLRGFGTLASHNAYDAAVYNASDVGLITHTVISNFYPYVQSGGGLSQKGVYTATASGARLEHSLVVRNRYNMNDTRASLIYNLGKITCCTIACNDINDRDDNQHVRDGTIEYSVIAGNTIAGSAGFKANPASAMHCVGDGAGMQAGFQTASAAELFRSPEEGDWRLKASATKAVGIIPHSEAKLLALPAVDLLGQPRLVGGLDAGCYECQNGGMILMVR